MKFLNQVTKSDCRCYSEGIEIREDVKTGNRAKKTTDFLVSYGSFTV